MGTGTVLEVSIADGVEEIPKQGRGDGAKGSPGDRKEHYNAAGQAASVEGGGRCYCTGWKGGKTVTATVADEGGQVILAF